MCLILFAHEARPGHRLILAANRDEFLSRPTAPMAFWADCHGILAGRDLKQGGTWLGMDRSGRMAALTNYRDPASVNPQAPSRGAIIPEYLESGLPPARFLEHLKKDAHMYNGFNIIMGDPEALFWFSNRQRDIHRLSPGIYGLSNHLLNTPWHKVRSGIKGLSNLVHGLGDLDEEALFTLLSSREIPPDTELPDTGVGLEWERILAPMFITSPLYGTRSSTVLVMDDQGRSRLTERTFDAEENNGYDERTFSV
ncbi:MAG: NRDE family protein [Pseudomonadota bacterium]